MVTQYADLIAQCDKALSLMRVFWMEARDDGEKRKYMTQINEMLDQRLGLMAAQKAAAQLEVAS